MYNAFPELLEACKEALRAFSEHPFQIHEVRDNLKSAIAKAEE